MGAPDFRPALEGLLWILDDDESYLTVIHPATARVVYLPLPGGQDLDLAFHPDQLEVRGARPGRLARWPSPPRPPGACSLASPMLGPAIRPGWATGTGTASRPCRALSPGATEAGLDRRMRAAPRGPPETGRVRDRITAAIG